MNAAEIQQAEMQSTAGRDCQESLPPSACQRLEKLERDHVLSAALGPVRAEMGEERRAAHPATPQNWQEK